MTGTYETNLAFAPINKAAKIEIMVSTDEVKITAM